MTCKHISPEVIDQMRQDANTMNCKQMAEKYGTTSAAMNDRLVRRGIKCQRVRNNWNGRIDEIRTLAERMTPRQLAEHCGMKTDYAYTLLQRHNIKAAASTRTVQLKGQLEALQQLAPGMTAAELAAHFDVDPRTVRVHLKRLGLECKSIERAPKKPKVKRVAAKKPEPRAKARPKQAAKPAPKPVPAQVPQRAAAPKPTIKRPVEIIMPASAKVTIVEFCPPPGTRICNGSSTQHYSPAQHGGAMRSYR